MKDFSPGQTVRLVRNINKTGVLVRKSDEDGNWIVKWDNRDDYDDVSERRIESVGAPLDPSRWVERFSLWWFTRSAFCHHLESAKRETQ